MNNPPSLLLSVIPVASCGSLTECLHKLYRINSSRTIYCHVPIWQPQGADTIFDAVLMHGFSKIRKYKRKNAIKGM